MKFEHILVSSTLLRSVLEGKVGGDNDDGSDDSALAKEMASDLPCNDKNRVYRRLRDENDDDDDCAGYDEH